jgi:hypothetical protein
MRVICGHQEGGSLPLAPAPLRGLALPPLRGRSPRNAPFPPPGDSRPFISRRARRAPTAGGPQGDPAVRSHHAAPASVPRQMAATGGFHSPRRGTPPQVHIMPRPHGRWPAGRPRRPFTSCLARLGSMPNGCYRRLPFPHRGTPPPVHITPPPPRPHGRWPVGGPRRSFPLRRAHLAPTAGGPQGDTATRSYHAAPKESPQGLANRSLF